jgi:hypothetical protein
MSQQMNKNPYCGARIKESIQTDAAHLGAMRRHVGGALMPPRTVTQQTSGALN